MEAARNDARQAGIVSSDGMRIVSCTTRFATIMCVIIACVKISVYVVTKQDVMKTSVLDSMGDLMANAITLYTGYRMASIDRKKYPIGQSKFESLGCLVFSTLMFAMLFGNALGNLDSLAESKDDVGYKAISRFFHQAGGALGQPDGEFLSWNKDVKLDQDGQFFWMTKDKSIDNPLIPFFEAVGDDAEKAMAGQWSEDEPKVNREWIVKQTADYENDAKEWEELKFQNSFLACCATYKFCLWLYCITIAIPRSGSSVLVALATDMRNDFCCTSFIIFSTFIAFLCKDSLSAIIAKEKVDPFVSLLLSMFIMWTWGQLMIEHMTILSQKACEQEYREAVVQEIIAVVQTTPCSIDERDVVVYTSSSKHTVEVSLTVSKPEAPFQEVAITVQTVKGRILALEDIERVIVCTQLPIGM